MKPLVIFGTSELAEVAHYYFQHDTPRDIKCFTVDQAYIKNTSWKGLPVIPFETIQEVFPPKDYDMFVAIGYHHVNRLRRDKYNAVKSLGYHCPSYISSKSVIWSEHIGDNCFILENNTIQPFAQIGNNVTLWSGNHIGHHAIIEDHSFITSHVVVSGKVVVGEGSFIGINATLRDHIRIGRYCIIGAGVLVMKDAVDKEVYSQKRTIASNISSEHIRKL